MLGFLPVSATPVSAIHIRYPAVPPNLGLARAPAELKGSADSADIALTGSRSSPHALKGSDARTKALSGSA